MYASTSFLVDSLKYLHEFLMTYWQFLLLMIQSGLRSGNSVSITSKDESILVIFPVLQTTISYSTADAIF